MRLLKLAKDYLRSAEVRLKSAELAYSDGDYPDVVRFSQECVELSLKACLRLVGIEYPKEHDVSRVLRAVSDRFPDWFKGEVRELSEVSMDLTSKRGPSMYGIESASKAPSDLFDKRDAENALSKARYVLGVARKFLLEMS